MSDKIHLDRTHLHGLYRQMLRIRRFEAKCVELYQAQQIQGFLHLYDGEEAVAVGVMSALQTGDAVVATYREHGHALARGVPMNTLLAEMMGKVQGCCRGRGGSMHLFDLAHRFFGGNAIVGGGLVCPFFYAWDRDSSLLMSGLVAGTAAYLVDRLWRQRTGGAS